MKFKMQRTKETKRMYRFEVQDSVVHQAGIAGGLYLSKEIVKAAGSPTELMVDVSFPTKEVPSGQ